MRFLFITLKKCSMFSHSTPVSTVVTLFGILAVFYNKQRKNSGKLLTTISFIAFITTVIVTIATLKGGKALLISTSEFFRRAADVSWNFSTTTVSSRDSVQYSLTTISAHAYHIQIRHFRHCSLPLRHKSIWCEYTSSCQHTAIRFFDIWVGVG